MNKAQEFTEAAKASAKTVLDFLVHQSQQVARLVGKKPKGPSLSWDSIIDECFPGKQHAHVSNGASALAKRPELNRQLALLPPEIIDELMEGVRANTMDEIPMIRLYEKLYECEVKILRGHVHFYQANKETFDYAALKLRVLGKFSEHKQHLALLDRS
jgi:hypothetical protein